MVLKKRVLRFMFCPVRIAYHKYKKPPSEFLGNRQEIFHHRSRAFEQTAFVCSLQNWCHAWCCDKSSITSWIYSGFTTAKEIERLKGATKRANPVSVCGKSCSIVPAEDRELLHPPSHFSSASHKLHIYIHAHTKLWTVINNTPTEATGCKPKHAQGMNDAWSGWTNLTPNMVKLLQIRALKGWKFLACKSAQMYGLCCREVKG